ncbi:Metallo-hydrolase/oxidoreductase [Hysterangium stoloniferum]|nr:Metallo-hydrolase/oxidoreductase [Hysterangium stoloniferum]
MFSRFLPSQTSGKPSHHADEGATSFRNPWGESKGLLASGQVFNRFPLEWEKSLHAHPAPRCKLVKPDFGRSTPDEGAVKATWLGHAGFMVQLQKDPSGHHSKEPTRVVFDPIWSERASPSQMAGPRRRLQPPCDMQELPDFHFVVISHNHYDHLDWPTIEQIFKLRGPRVRYLVPLGNKQWFCAGGIPADQVTELDWWQDAILSRNDTEGGVEEVRFICTPAQHGSEIGEKYGPFDLAMLPIWRGGSLSFIASMGLRVCHHPYLRVTDGLHASPAHAVSLHKDIRSRHSLGMHFATFAGSDIEAFEPIVELIAAKEEQGVGDWDEDWGFGTIDVGATVTLPTAMKAKEEVGIKISHLVELT